MRGRPEPLYDKREGKKPVLLIILPILMVLVVLGTLYLAYRDDGQTGRDGVSAVQPDGAAAVKGAY